MAPTPSPEVRQYAAAFGAIVANAEQVIQGKAEAIRLATVAMISEGHLLIEDVPGVGKTSLARALAGSIGGKVSRIQFTPDLLPSDVTGVTVYSRSTATFEFRPGPVFANVVVGDEINRASPKTQSALLESMEERQVTVDGTSHRLPRPFLVIATQNPIEHEGTYRLPEAQLDRFLMKITMGYPAREAELAMLDHNDIEIEVDPVASIDDIGAMIEVARLVHVAPSLKAYIVDLATASRRHKALRLGASPRSCLALQRACRAWAAARGRDYVVPDDIKQLVGPVLSHRLVLTPEAAISGRTAVEILAEVIGSVTVPTARS